MPLVTEGCPIFIPNGTQIQSAIFPQITHGTDRQTDRQMGYATTLFQHPLIVAYLGFSEGAEKGYGQSAVPLPENFSVNFW